MQQGTTFYQLNSWPRIHTEAKAQRSAVLKFRATDYHFPPRRSIENSSLILEWWAMVGETLLGERECTAWSVCRHMKGAAKISTNSMVPVKHFLTHYLEFDYEVNRLEFCSRDVIFPLPLVSSAIKTCLSALSNDNDKCSRGKRCHEKHTKDFSEGKKRTSTPRWTLFQRRNYAQWEAKNEMLAALLRLW